MDSIMRRKFAAVTSRRSVKQMSEFIKREDVIAHLRECQGTPPEVAYTYSILKAIECFVEELPAADVAPMVHGRWVITKEHCDIIDVDVVRYTCSACGEYRLSATTLSQATNFCPNCGAKNGR